VPQPTPRPQRSSGAPARLACLGAHIRFRARAVAAAFAALGLAAAGCAPLDPTPPRPPGPAEQAAAAAATLGVLDAVYDRASWEWMVNVDGRPLLKHTKLPQCFLDPDPPHHFHEPEFRVKREVKTFGATRYDVVLAFEGKDFWEAVYIPSSTDVPILGVYAPGPCQAEAERIIEAYEQQRQRYVDTGPKIAP
jgi:hypothetical protein